MLGKIQDHSKNVTEEIRQRQSYHMPDPSGLCVWHSCSGLWHRTVVVRPLLFWQISYCVDPATTAQNDVLVITHTTVILYILSAPQIRNPRENSVPNLWYFFPDSQWNWWLKFSFPLLKKYPQIKQKHWEYYMKMQLLHTINFILE